MEIKPELYHVKIESTNAWGYGDDATEQFNKAFDEVKAKLEKVPFLKDRIKPYPNPADVNHNYDLLDQDAMVLSKDQLVELAVANMEFEVKQHADVAVDITQQLVELAEKPIRITQESGASNTYNNRCDVHLPGNMLAMYNEMMILEDACTDVLQSNLNAGWRIVAACPQPDQRRPDYVLGRFNPNHEADGSASRGE